MKNSAEYIESIGNSSCNMYAFLFLCVFTKNSLRRSTRASALVAQQQISLMVEKTKTPSTAVKVHVEARSTGRKTSGRDSGAKVTTPSKKNQQTPRRPSVNSSRKSPKKGYHDYINKMLLHEFVSVCIENDISSETAPSIFMKIPQNVA